MKLFLLQALCYAIEAAASRVSDSPLILGTNCPLLGSLKDRLGEDLSRWGAARTPFYERMRERAIHKCDECGVFHASDDQSIATLLLIDAMLTGEHLKYLLCLSRA